MKNYLLMSGCMAAALWFAQAGFSAETIRLSGTVVDAAGKPVAGAAVECIANDRSRPFEPAAEETSQSLTTGADGAFEFKMPRAAITVLARKAGFGPAWNQYWNPQQDITDARLGLSAPGVVAGKVVDDSGKPVADAEVWVSAAYQERPVENGTTYSLLVGKAARACFLTRSDAAGKFRFDNFPTNTSADVVASKPGKVTREPQREYMNPELMSTRTGVEDLTVTLDPAGSVEGKIQDQETGQPITGARLWLQRTGSSSSFLAAREPARSDADGKFSFADMAPGSYRLYTTIGTNDIPDKVAEIVSVSVEAGQVTRDVRVPATRGGFVEVSVVGKEDGKPLAGAGVNLNSQNYHTSANSGSNGAVLLRVPPGEYRVSAYRDNMRSEPVTASTQADQTNRTTIELNPPPKITGVVRDPSGAPAAGVELRVIPEWRANVGRLKTDDQGRYEMKWDPQRFSGQQDAMCLIARLPARNLAAAHELEASTKTLDLALVPALTVAGSVADPDGKPITNANITVYLQLGNTGSTIEEKPAPVNAQGRFEISALPPDQKYNLWANAKGFGSAYQNVESEEAATNWIDMSGFVLQVADQRIAGQVVDADDKPVAGAYVHMYGQGQPNSSVRTDGQGRFAFDQVCAGSVQLSSNIRNAYGNVRVEAGETNAILKLGENTSYSSREAPRRPSLRGKPLPDLAAVGLAAEAVPADKPVLLCLFDLEQRPSRRCLRSLSEQLASLQEKGLVVAGLQAAIITPEAFKEWQDGKSVAFPVGRVADKSDKTKWASGVESFPWLILTDAKRQVVAEGFDIEELAAKLKDLK